MDYVIVGQAVATVFLMYRQNHHLAEANRIAREKKKQPGGVITGWSHALRHYWPLIAMGVLAAASFVPRLLPKPIPEFIQSWGRIENRVWVAIDTDRLGNIKPDRLILVARPANNSISSDTDTNIAKSATFQEQEHSMMIEVFMSPEFMTSVAQVGGGIEHHVLQVPEDFPIESVHSIADAERRGAKALASKIGWANHGLH